MDALFHFVISIPPAQVLAILVGVVVVSLLVITAL